eukprot:Awhi_evm1s13572
MDDIACINSMKLGKRYLNKMRTSNMDREESVEHLLIECPLYNVRDEVLLRIINLSEDCRMEWFDGDETLRCVM